MQRESAVQMQYFPSEGRIDKMYFPYYGKKAHVSIHHGQMAAQAPEGNAGTVRLCKPQMQYNTVCDQQSIRLVIL